MIKKLLENYKTQTFTLRHDKVFRVLIYLLLLSVLLLNFLPKKIADTYSIFALFILIVTLLFYVGFRFILLKNSNSYGNAWVVIWLGILLLFIGFSNFIKIPKNIVFVVIILLLIIAILGAFVVWKLLKKNKK